MSRSFLLKAIGLFFVLLLIVSCKKETEAKCEKIILSNGWKLHPTDSLINKGDIISVVGQSVAGWYDAKVPSTVMGTLVDNGLYPDLFVGDNIKKVDKIQFDSSWWYRKEFSLPALKHNQHVAIRFDGISYYANVWLNGNLIASRDSLYGTYRQFEFDITPYISENNVLAVEVFRAQAGDPNVGFADWNPRPADENMGIFREVSLSITGIAKLNNTYIHSTVNTSTLDEAWLVIETEVENLSDEKLSGELVGNIEAEKFSYPLTLEPREKKKVKLTSEQIQSLHIDNPRLWWCNNLGTPELYDLDLYFRTHNTISDRDSIRFGIRQIDTYFTEEGHRGFKLNGKELLLKSAGWTDDIFLRDTPESNEAQVRYVKDMNLNMIRFENFWGNSSNVYDLCDELGLLALVGWTCQWEWDAYFGKPCSLEYGCIESDTLVNLVAEYFEDQVLWLRNHPSIMAWMPGSDMLPAPKLEEKYLAFLKEADDRVYIGAAKKRESEISGPSGTKMAGPYEYVGPNYWYIDTLYGGAFGFNTETGIGAQLPELESIKRFIPEDKLWPINNSAWDFHCTASTTAMNNLDVLTTVMNNKYGQAKDLNDYLMKANLINYDGTRAMFEAFRVNLGKTTGIVQWMLNSAWPSLYWQLYDYYRVPTAAYYSVKKANMPIQLIYNYGNNSVYAVNESVNEISAKAIVQVFALDSKLLSKKEIDLNAKSNTSVQILELDPMSENVFLALELIDKDGKHIADNFYTLSAKQDEYVWDKSSWVGTPMKAYNDYKKLSEIETVQLKVSIESKVDNKDYLYRIKLVNSTDKIGFFTSLKLKNDKGEIVQPVFWSDNYISLLPNTEQYITCKVAKGLIAGQQLHVEVQGWNVPKEEVSL